MEASGIMERIRLAEQQRDSKYTALWQDCLRRYRSQAAGKREGSNIFVPQTFMQCEVIKARIAESLFASRPYVAALPREGTDEAKAKKVEMLLDWQMNERMDLPRLVGEKIVEDLVVYGTAVTYTGWEYRTREVKEARYEALPVTDEHGMPVTDEKGVAYTYEGRQVERVLQVVSDDPLVVSVPLADFYVDPEAETVKDARYLGHKEYKSKRELEQCGYEIDWEKVPELEGESEDEGGMGLYLIHHYWEEGRHLVFLNREMCILEEENPFWHGEYPYDKCCYVAVNGEFYGIGVPEILMGLQDELNTCRNQRIDYNSLSLRRMWKLRKGCGLTARDLIWRQNGVLQVENMDDVQEINIQGLPGDAFANENSIKRDMQDTTGCHDVIMGASYSQETATTTVTRDNNASLRFKTVMNALVKDLLLPIARKFVALDKQFLTEQRAMRLLNRDAGDLLQVETEDMSGEYDIIYCGSAIQSEARKEQNKEKALQAYSLALADPAYLQDDEARLELFRRVLETLDIKDAERLLPKPRMELPKM